MGSPSSRSIFIASLISAAMRAGSSMTIRHELSQVPDYYSRGKGRGGWHKTSGIPASNKCNNGGTGRPHQNKREMARRVRQGLARAAA